VDDFDDVIDEIWRRGRAAWPNLFVDKQIIRPSLPDTPTAQHAEDRYLVIGCASGDPIALQILEDTVLAPAARTIRRYDANQAFVDEVLQRVRIHLLVADPGQRQRILGYDGRAALRAWVGTCAVRMALYLMRGTRNLRESPLDWPDVIADLPTGHAELDEVRAKFAAAFREAWRESCAELAARHRAILRMSFVEGASIQHIAATYAVNRVTVWRWLEDAKTTVLDATRRRLRARLSAGDPSAASLLDLIGSQFELGLSVLS
jgi:RNA polymerase sigma-70 factor